MTPSFPAEPKLFANPIYVATGTKRSPDQKDKGNFQAFLQTAKKQFHEAEEGSAEIRKAGLEDWKFYWGEQWPQAVEADRTVNNRPCLTFNHCKSFVAQVTNEERQTRPAIQINPVGDGADVDTADVIQGLVRHIEQISEAEVAYDKAFEHAAIMGFGYFRLRADYLDDSSTDQEIFIEPIDDAFRVYLDPTAKQKDRSDARYAFIVSDLTEDQFHSEYGEKAQFQSLADFQTIGDNSATWYTGNTIRVVEYYWVVQTPQLLVRLKNGRTVPHDKLKDADLLDLNENGKPITRMSMKRQIKWCKMTAAEILEQRDVPGKVIPIVAVIGREGVIDGKRRLEGMIRDVKDAQRAYNFDRTAIVETNNLVPKAPWLAYPEAIEGHEQMYQQSNIRNFPFLYHNLVRDSQGNALPPPQRVSASPAIQHLVAATQLDTQDMQTITGLHAPSLGEVSGNRSGKAVEALQREGDVANFNFVDNLKVAIRLCGRIIVDWIPEIYDVPRAQRIVNPDGTHKVVLLNHPFMENGQQKIYDVTVGRYDVTVDVGPSYASRRKEFVASVLSLAQAAPQLIGFIADLLVRNMDWPGAQEIADRLKKMLPPQLQDGGPDGQGQPPLPAQAQAQLQQLTSQLQQTAAALQQAQTIIATRQVEAAGKMQVAELDAKVKRELAELNARVMLAVQAMKDGQAGWEKMVGHDYQATEHQLSLIDAQTERDAQAQAQKDQQAHQQQLQQGQQAHDQGMQQADQQHQQQMAAKQPGGGEPPPTPPQ